MNESFGIKSLITKNINEIENIIQIFISSSINVRNGIIDEKNYEVCMISLLRDTYMCNLLWRYVGLMLVIDENPKWIEIDNLFIKYIQKYHKNINFKEKLIKIHHHFENEKQIEYCKFLEKMIDCCNMNNKTGRHIKEIIQMLENRIYNTINIHPIITFSNQKHELTVSNFYNLIDNNSSEINHQIENKYNSRSNNVLTDFAKLIVSRKSLANVFNFSSYFNFINRGKIDTSESLKGFLNELDSKLCSKIKFEMSSIQQKYKLSKINNCDIIKHIRANKNDNQFNIPSALKKIFIIIEKYFSIKFTTTETLKNFIVYNASYDNKIIGRLFLDINYNKTKKLNKPLTIRLSDKMRINKDGNNNTTISEIALIANYHSEIEYDDIVLIFKEFGHIINNLMYNSKVGLINYDNEFSNYLPSLMEYFMYDVEIIKTFVDEQYIVDQIEFVRDIDLCYKLKQKCINAKFDHLIHNSEPLLEIIENALSTKFNADDELIQTYQNIYKEYMDPIKNVFNINNITIDPNVIINEINGSQGILYSNLINEIFAYATYWIIKNDESQRNEFSKTVLSDGVTNYRDLIRTFLNKSKNINCFNIYVKNIIKNTSIDDIMETEDNNYFEEECDDYEQIIKINK